MAAIFPAEPAPRPTPYLERLLAVACLAAVAWSGIESLDLVGSGAVRFVGAWHWPLFLGAHLAIGLTACLLQLLILEMGSGVVSSLARRLLPGPRAAELGGRLTYFALHGLVWTGASFTALHHGRLMVLSVGLAVIAVVAAVGPAPLPWRKSQGRRKDLVLAALGCLALVILLHLFNRQWMAKFYFPVHVAATLFALTIALHGAAYALRAAGAPASAPSSRSRRLILVAAAAITVTAVLIQSSNDVRHVLFNRAFDAKDLLYVGRKLRGAGFGEADAHVPEPLAQAPAGPRRKVADNVVLITIDALRADHLPVYGYARDTAPALTRFAGQAQVFDWAWSVAPETSVAMHAIFAEDGGGPQLTHALAQAGVPRSAVLDGIFRWRLSRAWTASFDNVASIEGSDDVRLAEVAAREIEGGHLNGFMWIHLFGPHQPYLRHPSKSFGDSDLDLYDGEIFETDRAVGRILEAIDGKGLAVSTAVIVMGDHGEEMGEHGGTAHGWDIYNELLHIPLLVRLPQQPGRRIGTHVTQRDLPLTIVDLLGVRGSATGFDRSLVPLLLRPKEAPPRVVMTGPLSSFHVGALLSGSWKLGYCLFNDSYALFDLASDPGEQVNLFEARPDVAGPMRALLHARLAGANEGRF
jgi:hypothetical protein